MVQHRSHQVNHGTPIMFKKEDIEWLTDNYGKVKCTSDNSELEVTIKFTATYNSETDQFLILLPGTNNTIGGTVLTCSYTVLINYPSNNRSLPSVCVDKEQIPYLTDRHVNAATGTACLCGPIEEVSFVENGMTFSDFIQRLVIPFLYGQQYYEEYEEWPWMEYDHGAIGILQSYANNNNLKFVQTCLTRLQEDKNWKVIKTLLTQNSEIKGHSNCICDSNDHIRRCHPDVWPILNRLRTDIKQLGLIVP